MLWRTLYLIDQVVNRHVVLPAIGTLLRAVGGRRVVGVDVTFVVSHHPGAVFDQGNGLVDGGSLW